MAPEYIEAPMEYGMGTTKHFTDPEKALAWVREIYETNTKYLTQCFEEFSQGKVFDAPVLANYPYVQIDVSSRPAIDPRRSYGYIGQTGRYKTTLTRPDIFDFYYTEQFSLLRQHHPDAKLEVGVSDTPIPMHFALGENYHLEGGLTKDQLRLLPETFILPDLSQMDDAIANGVYEIEKDGIKPLALFTAPRVDVSIQRLKHYTGTDAKHFQNYVIYTNYQFYVDQFVEHGHQLMEKAEDEKTQEERAQYTAFVEPGNKITENQNLNPAAKTIGELPGRLPQMPAYHLQRADGSGITLINIGVGPSNAKTITDHVAVLRPHAWMMLGHCAGLRSSQSLGDYVLAHAYIREDGVLDQDLPLWVPIPALAEVQVALEQAVSEVTGLGDYDFKSVMRTGTVATISDRNWELRDYREPVLRFSQSRAVALEMESATIAANGFRFRVPYGTLLCVSDKPLHGQLKLPGMADKFYQERVQQHLRIGMMAMEKMRSLGLKRLHSRKLRSFNEVAFQ